MRSGGRAGKVGILKTIPTDLRPLRPALGWDVEVGKFQFFGEWQARTTAITGSGIDGTVFEEHKSRGFRQIRKGIPLPVMIACACDPRTKNLVGIPPLFGNYNE
jgi:hypothetical protein